MSDLLGTSTFRPADLLDPYLDVALSLHLAAADHQATDLLHRRTFGHSQFGHDAIHLRSHDQRHLHGPPQTPVLAPPRVELKPIHLGLGVSMFACRVVVQGVVDGAADGHPWPLLLWALPRDGVTACYVVGG